MDKEEKLRMLQALSEKELTKKFLIPLFESPGMGCKNVRYIHRCLEFGKDVIYYKEDEYGNRKYTGVQVKKTHIATRDINGIQRQVQEAFGEPFKDLSDGKKKDLDKVIVLTSREFAGEAKDSFWANMKAVRLEKMVTCVDGILLLDLLDKHLPSVFWDEYDYFNKYFNSMRRDFTTIKDVSAIGQKEPISLEEIYVSMRLSEEIEEREIPTEQEWKIFDDKRANEEIKELSKQKEGVKVVDADLAVAGYKRLVIVGDPGSGKTTLVKHLALKWCRENLEKQERVSIPVPITLRKLADSNKSIREYIDGIFENYEFPNAKKWIEKDLKSGKCRLLLDGFDELATQKSQKKISEEIEKFIRKYKKVPVLVTSRIVGYHDELRGFTKAELLEFNDEQISKFTENWFGQKDPERAKSMLASIKGNERIKALARNPLMIAIIAIIYEEDRKLPKRRTDLYQRCVEVLLSKWDVQKRLSNRFSADKKEFILSKLAFYGHAQNKRIMSQKEIRSKMLEYFPQVGLEETDFEPFLEEIWQRSFLIRQVSMDSYDFLHLSFQEYFTAFELTKRDDAIDIILKHIDEPWWEEPILLYAGIKKNASALIRTIRDKIHEDIFYSNLLLCGKCIADADFTDPLLKETISDELYDLYKTSKFELLTDNAIEVIGLIKPDKIIDELIDNFTKGHKNYRAGTAYALGMIGSEKAIKPLINSLKDSDSDVRGRAASALGMIGSVESIKPLIKVLKDKDRIVRLRASTALGMIGSEKAIKPLINSLKDSDSDVRGRTASALGMIGREKAIKPLINSLKDSDSDVRGRAAAALGMIGREKAIKPLINSLKDYDSDVRGRSTSALGMISIKKAIEPLIDALKDADSNVRWKAAYALGSIGIEKKIKSLINALKDKNNDVFRGSAALAIGRIGSQKAIKLLIKALSDKVGYVRWSAVSALGFIGSERAIEPLLKVLTDDLGYVRGRAAAALGFIGGEKAIEPLLKALADKEGTVRRSSAYALGRIVSEKAIEPLINTLKDGFFGARIRATQALGRIGNEKAIEPLLKALTDNNYFVRNSAFASLMSISKKCRKRIIAPSA